MKMMWMLFLFVNVTWAATPKTVELNNKAVKELEAQNFQAAEKILIDALAVEPLAAELHYNLGLAFLGQAQVEKAIRSFSFALKEAKIPETKFMSAFNLGFIHGKMKNIDEALNYYQQALTVVPNSVETKTNIELLIQQQQNQNQNQDQQNQDQQQKDGESKEQKESDKSDQEKEQDQKDQENKQYQKPKPQPKNFKSQELTQGDVNKILGEIKQQEQKIRAEFNRRDAKEKPRAKDW